MDELLKENMGMFAEHIPEILSGPYYKGIWEFDFRNGKPVYQISCGCTEADVRKVQRKLNYEITKLVEERLAQENQSKE